MQLLLEAVPAKPLEEEEEEEEAWLGSPDRRTG